MSAYVLTALPAPKRVRAIQPEGQQEEEEENIWAYMQFSDAQMQEQQQQQQAQPEEGAPPDAAPDPEAVTEAFQAAKGELEWLLCTLDRLKAGEVLAVSRCDKEASQKLAELAVAQSLKLARRRSALAAAAEQLRAGAAALSLAVSREDSFYIELARLQRCWKLRMNPPGSEQLFTFDLSLLPPTLAHTPLAAAVAAAGGGGGGADGGWERAAIMRGPLGDLRLQVPAPALPASAALPGSAAAAQPAPRVCVGTREVHSFLLARQRALLWAAARGCIEAEESGGLGPSLGRPDGPGGAGGAASAAAGPGSAAASTARAKRSGDAASAAPGTWQGSFLYALARLLLRRVAGGAEGDGSGGGSGLVDGGGSAAAGSAIDGAGAAVPQDAMLASLRPLVLSHALHVLSLGSGSHRAWHGSGGRPAGGVGGGSGPRRGGPPSLLEDLGAWLLHNSARDMLRAAVDRLVAGSSPARAVVCSLSPSLPCTSAMQLQPVPSWQQRQQPASPLGKPDDSPDGGANNRAEGSQAAPSPLLLVLQGSELSLEGPGAAGQAAADGPLWAGDGRVRVAKPADSARALAAALAGWEPRS